MAEFASNRTGLAGLALLAIMALAVTAGPSIRGLDPFDIVSAPFMPPDRATPFGADYVGRDVLAGTLHGGRASLAVGLSAAALTAAIGLTVGVLGGWFGGKLDAVLTKTTEFFQVLPTLLFAMVLVSVFSPSLRTVALAIGATSWMNVARLARAEMMRLKNLDFVSSAAASGASGLYVMTRVALPNALPPIIVQAAFDVSWAILLEGSLSYLGLGDPNRMSWGLIIGQNKNYVLDAWWTVVFPGAAIFLSVLGVCLAGDALNDALNPRLRRR
ncbi:MAG: ABC transporter permease [Deltaproteobacteria bacterium]|nr:ABC transporter permease [Deltaproteobacteria bacterium]